MSHTPHELSADFPELTETIHRLKTEDAHFQSLYEKYHTLNRHIHRAETDIEPTSDEHLEEMKAERVHLKDALYTLLRAAS